MVPNLATRAWTAIRSSKRAGARKRRLASPTTTSRPRSTIASQLADRARPPQLGDGVVEVGQVVGVEHDPLRIAFAVADAQLVDEVGHRVRTVESGAVWGRTATELAAGLRAREFSAREVMEAHLERIAASTRA